MCKLNYHYIVDTKLLFYSCAQQSADTLDTINRIAETLHDMPKGKVYLTADIGKSAYRLGISSYYKGRRREQKEKQSAEEQENYKQFSKDYIEFVKLCQHLPVITMYVEDVEADDVASILAHDLSKDPNNRIALITRDRDWLHSIIDAPNVKIVSPYYMEDDLRSTWAKNEYNVRNREEFTLKKTLEGDDGDSILHPKWLGKAKTDEIWERCIAHETVTLDVLKKELFAWIAEQKNPDKFTVPVKYVEHGVAETIEEVIDVNYKLAGTMMRKEQLTEKQQEQFEASLKAVPSSVTIDPITYGMEHFGRPIILTETARRVFKWQQT